MKSLALIFLVLLGCSYALTIRPDYIDIKDTGDQSLPKMNVGLTIDCDTRQITVMASSNKTGEQIDGARIFLFNTQYGYDLVATGSTIEDGSGTIDVLGNINFLTAMLVLRVDQPSYQSRQIEFEFTKCFQVPKNSTVGQAQNNPGNAQTPGGQNNSPENNTAGNNGPQQNSSTNNQMQNTTLPISKNTKPQSGSCIPGFALAALAICCLARSHER